MDTNIKNTVVKYGELAIEKFREMKDDKEISKVERTFLVVSGGVLSIYIICKNGGVSFGKLKIGSCAMN